jgi:hypothetical protein
MKVLDFIRRFVQVSALGLWLGGFAVYTSAVISIGHRHFPGRSFGFVTAEVTSVLQILSLVAIALCAISLACEWRHLPIGYRWAFASVGLVMLGLLAGSYLVHATLDAVLDADARQIRDPERFDPLHERYELVASLHWGFGLLYLGILIASWRRLDRGRPGA